MNVLIVNAGSSSLKYQLINTKTEEVAAKGICERIGTDGALIDHKLLTKDLTLCDPMDCSTPGFSVLHHLPELAQTHVH